MDRDPHRCWIAYDHDSQRYEKVVDDGTAGSSYPSSLLFWLRLHLKLIEPVNNPFYTPTHPPAA